MVKSWMEQMLRRVAPFCAAPPKGRRSAIFGTGARGPINETVGRRLGHDPEYSGGRTPWRARSRAGHNLHHRLQAGRPQDPARSAGCRRRDRRIRDPERDMARLPPASGAEPDNSNRDLWADVLVCRERIPERRVREAGGSFGPSRRRRCISAGPPNSRSRRNCCCR